MIAPSLFVPDASVILKWAFRSPDEHDNDKALGLLNLWLSGSCEFILPSLWVFECGNILGLKTPDTAQEILDIFLGYRFQECSMSLSIAIAALKLMRECKATFYDTAYHAVALEKAATLITADAVYYRKAKAKGNIMLLENFSP